MQALARFGQHSALLPIIMKGLSIVCLVLGALVASALASSISDADIQRLSQELFEADADNVQAKSIGVNIQGRTGSNDKDDQAPEPLLTVPSQVKNSGTIGLLRKLFDNYEPDTSVSEKVTAQEVQEEIAFLNAALNTRVLKTAMNFLAKEGLVPTGTAAQRDFLHKLWFTLYSRKGGRLGSSAFEHVFLGEVKGNSVSGMHSWPYFNYEEEQAASNKKVDYKGHIKSLNLGKGAGSLLKMRFTWRGANKPVNSLLVGSSPELELALYTVCFLARPDAKCGLSVNNRNFQIQTYSWDLRDGRGTKTIGTAYPIL